MKLVLLASKALPSSAIDLHPQPADIDFIAAKTRSAVASGNGARTGIDQIVANDPRAVGVASAILQLMGIASAFGLRSASYGGRSRSLSYGGQVAPLILRAIVAWDKVAGRQTLNCFEARPPLAKEEMPARPSSALTPASPQRRLLESWSSAPHPFHLSRVFTLEAFFDDNVAVR
jgi:hypothetical protein